jgi:rRNA maturation endonuclease Nob1
MEEKECANCEKYYPMDKKGCPFCGSDLVLARLNNG